MDAVNGLSPQVRADFAKWSQSLQRLAPQAAATAEILDSVAALESGDTGETKKNLREQLWNLRQECPQSTPDLRKTYEKLRNLSLDNSEKFPSSHYTIRANAAEIPNFQPLENNYWRGGQPDQEGLDWLAAQGIRTQIDLRGDDRDNAWNPPTRYPMTIFHVPVADFQSPTFKQVEEFLELVNNPAHQPVYVHCKAGIGRTGVMTACWRVSQGMTAQQALEVERINSYHGSLKQEQFVRDFEAYWKERNL